MAFRASNEYARLVNDILAEFSKSLSWEIGYEEESATKIDILNVCLGGFKIYEDIPRDDFARINQCFWGYYHESVKRSLKRTTAKREVDERYSDRGRSLAIVKNALFLWREQNDGERFEFGGNAVDQLWPIVEELCASSKGRKLSKKVVQWRLNEIEIAPTNSLDAPLGDARMRVLYRT